jgi:hypothetical protein
MDTPPKCLNLTSFTETVIVPTVNVEVYNQTLRAMDVVSQTAYRQELETLAEANGWTYKWKTDSATNIRILDYCGIEKILNRRNLTPFIKEYSIGEVDANTQKIVAETQASKAHQTASLQLYQDSITFLS